MTTRLAFLACDVRNQDVSCEEHACEHVQTCAYLDEGNAVVETLLDEKGLLAVQLRLLAVVGSDGLSLLIQTSLLLLLGLGLVLVQKAEELGGGVLVQRVGELSDGGGNL